MDIRLINMDDRFDRLARFRYLNPDHDNIDRVSAVDGSDINRLELMENHLLDPSLIYTDGAIGCAMSHVLQWNHAIQTGKAITVLEDDAVLAPNFTAETDRLIESLDDDWEIIFWAYNLDSHLSINLPPALGMCTVTFEQLERNAPEHFFKGAVDSRLWPVRSLCGIAAYSVSPSGAARLMQFCLPLRPMQLYYHGLQRALPNTGIDNMMCALLPQMKAYASFPPLAVPENDVANSSVQPVLQTNLTGCGIDYGTEDVRGILISALSGDSFEPSEDCFLIHFVLTSGDSDRPFGFTHYMAIRSAWNLHPHRRIILWCTQKGTGTYWEAIKPLVEIAIIPIPDKIFGNAVRHPAHQADVIRLAVLRSFGGLYLDLDTVCVRDMSSLLENSVVMAREMESTEAGPAQGKLGNAVIIAPLGSKFIDIWWETYKKFDGNVWNYHSVIVPAFLATQVPDLISILEPEAFFVPTWDREGLENLFRKNITFPQAYCHHLWESQSWSYLADIDENSVFLAETTYNQACKPHLPIDELDRLQNLHENYGVFSGVSTDCTEINSDRKTTFQRIYKNSVWGNGGDFAYSGPGSDPNRVPEYIKFICDYINFYQIKSVCDIGCGDFRIGSEIALQCTQTHFTALDIVDEVIAQNRIRYAGLSNCDFQQIDIVQEKPKPAQLAIIREVFQHLSNENIKKSIQNFDNFDEILICNNVLSLEGNVNAPHQDGADIRKGYLDLSESPFALSVELLARLPIRGRAGYLEIVRYRPLAAEKI